MMVGYDRMEIYNMKRKIIKIVSSVVMLFAFTVGTTQLNAIENSKSLGNGTLRAYIYITSGGGYWESSGRFSGSTGVAYLQLESNVPGSGYWRMTGSSSYVEDGGSRASQRSGGYARVYAYNNTSRITGVATGIY